MLIHQEMIAALNEQVGHEFGASLQSVAIAAYLAGESLPALAGKFYRQVDEERDHAMKLVRYIVETGGRLAIAAAPAPRCEFESVEETVKLALDWEKTVTGQINNLMRLAVRQSDYLTQGFLNWFVQEQLEEVSSMDHLLKLVQRAGATNLLAVESHVAALDTAVAKTC